MTSFIRWIVVGAVVAFVSGSVADAQEANRRVEITLEDGTTIQGTVLSETEDTIEISSEILGTLTIEFAHVRAIAALDSRGRAVSVDPDTNSILFVPTSETFPKGDGYYRNFEILFNNFGYAVTDDIAVSAMFAFPITGDLELGSIGAKVRLVSREAYPIGIAVAGTMTFVQDESATSLNGIVSVGDRRRSLSVVGSVTFADDEKVTLILLGGDVQIARNVKLIAEYGNAAEAVFDDADFNGLINVGFRAFWKSGSFTLSGLRPLEETGDELFAVPFGQVSLHF